VCRLERKVIAILAGDVRDIAAWDVIHSPLVEIQSHADIAGPAVNHPKVRVEFARKARVVLSLPESDETER
jgi:hypothetical protein